MKISSYQSRIAKKGVFLKIIPEGSLWNNRKTIKKTFFISPINRRQRFPRPNGFIRAGRLS